MEEMINQVLLMEKTEGKCADHLRDLLKELSEQDKEQNKTP
ncbi:hypothetical protein [Bacillus thuringiensis]|nr:hypothetical protein [Bacillus thuringiensis]